MLKRLKKAIKKALPEPVVLRLKKMKALSRVNSVDAASSYSIVSAAYNVEPYLDDFFSSIENQSIARKCLQVIMVDDGSTDGTAAVIAKWQEKYPGLITYLHKGNGGSASARNLGLKHAENEWVTFIDPDDFISPDYFEQVDKAAAARPEAKLLAVKEIYYREATGALDNTYPLRFQFSSKDQFFDISDEEAMPIVLSAACTFFRTEEIRRQELSADERIRPTFEDAHFVGRYLLNLEAGEVGLLSKPVYYYRKRAAQTSLTDGTYGTEDKILVQPRFGYLDLFNYAKSVKGYVPSNIQRMVMYDFSWYMKLLVGHPERTDFLSEEQKQEAMVLFREMCSHFDRELLYQQPGKLVGFEQKIAFSEGFMDVTPVFQKVFLRRVDCEQKTIHVRVLSAGVKCSLDGVPALPYVSKRADRTFLGDRLYSDYELYYRYDDLSQTIDFSWSEEIPTIVDVNGAEFECPVKLSDLVGEFTKKWDQYESDDLWLIMDRDTLADDNGEHFFRYMMKEHPKKQCFFALRKTSRDWPRLEAEGFNLVDFGTKEFEEIARRASTIISSQAEPYIMSYFGDHYCFSKKFVFLQHGVIRCDLSAWLNPMRVIDLMLVSTQGEYDSIVRDGSSYLFSENQIALTGLPRHDALLDKAQRGKEGAPTILIMPTWRKWICGSVLPNSYERSFNEAFLTSHYKRAWEEFLHGDYLRGLADQGCRVVLFPHMIISPYIKKGWFDVPDWVEIGSQDGSNSLQDYLAEASVFITDYSSLMFEAAYAGIPSIYFQFDADEFYSKHTYTRGYFDDEKDGFGPVVSTTAELEDSLRGLAESGWTMPSEYAQRIEKTFPHRDGKCCERTYEAICSLS
ncbi:MAG: glycosyltransferase [Eggerthellaceae bacterium]|nr:glycosyltransferase [Eggerthellaceae bacterium]